MSTYNTIAESNNFIVLDNYTKFSVVNEAPAVYQTEAALEREFIQDLIHQEGVSKRIKTPPYPSPFYILCSCSAISKQVCIALAYSQSWGGMVRGLKRTHNGSNMCFDTPSFVNELEE